MSNDPDVSFSRNMVSADFLGHSYRISGDVSTRTRPVADELNDPNTKLVIVDNVFVSHIQTPADITANYKSGALRKENISMVVFSREEDGRSKLATYGSYTGHTLRPIFLTTPGFEVRGYLEIAAKHNLRTYLIQQAEQFIPVTDASARVSLRPEYEFEGGMILVNRDHIGIFCLGQEKE